MNSTLQELLLTLRAVTAQASLPNAPGPASTAIAELHHPSAKYTFRSVYPDPATGGRFQSKDLGDVYARDLSDTAIFEKPFPVLPDPVEVDMKPEESVEDAPAKPAVDSDDVKPEEGDKMDVTDTAGPTNIAEAGPANGKEGGRHATGGREARTLADVRFRKGDYLAIAVRFPKTSAASGLPPITTGAAGALNIRGSAGTPASASGRGGFGGRDAGPARQIPWVTSPTTPTTGANPRDARRGANWRGGAPTGPARGGFGGRGDGPADRRGVHPPRDNGYGDRRGGTRGGGRGGASRGARRSRSGSRSPRRRSRSRDLSMASSRSKSRSRSRSPPRRDLK